ncbi:MAG TPA: hypothetical protein VGH72_33815 [Pseudonocardia sp.]|jgi:hypothetical protein
MPKEIIRHRGTEQYRGELSWSREGQFVQMTVGEVRTEHHEGTADTPSFDEQTFLAGDYIQLDRDGLNKLIRDARRARNQVFGADE